MIILVVVLVVMLMMMVLRTLDLNLDLTLLCARRVCRVGFREVERGRVVLALEEGANDVLLDRVAV